MTWDVASTDGWQAREAPRQYWRGELALRSSRAQHPDGT